MKKVFCFVLAVMLLCLCACSSASGKEEKATFRVGFSRTDITPEEMGVSLRGFGDEETRLSEDIISFIYADCLALTDKDGNTALIISLDLGGLNCQPQLREAISDATGVPLANIITSCSHQHSCPNDVYAQNWKSFMIQQVAAGAKKAMEDRAPATIETTTVTTDRMNFVRHYIMNDGTYAGDNFGSTASGYKEHVSQADNTMQLVKFVREGDKKDVLLTNFQGHPHLGSMVYYNSIHSDTVGVYRDEVSKALGCEVIYFSGAGGNVKMKSAIESENLTTDFKEHGRLLSKYAIDAEGSYTPMESGAIRSIQSDFEGTVDHSMDQYENIAIEMVKTFRSTGSNSQAMKLAGDSGISSWHHANAILAKIKMGKTRVIKDMGAIAVGELAFIAAPYEMFDQTGVYIKKESPFKMTVVCTIANGGNGYFPTKETFAYGSYESDTSKYVEGTAEALADRFLEMLNSLK